MILIFAGFEYYFEGWIFFVFDVNSWKFELDFICYCVMNMGFILDECIYVDDILKGVEVGLNVEVLIF